MRPRILLPLAAAAFVAAPATASADFAHVVGAGESLSSIAAADGLTVAQLAAANGVSPDAQLTTGSTVMIPPQASTACVSVGSERRRPPPRPVTAMPTPTTARRLRRLRRTGTTVYTSTSSGSSYVVQPGDTLSAIAARAGRQRQRAWPRPTASTRTGCCSPAGAATRRARPRPFRYSDLRSASASATGQPVGAAAAANPGGPPYPTPERVSGSQVGQIASANGVPPALAQAIGWQESGFNNDLVSSAGARGVMQIMPGTWDWINRSLTAGTPLDPASAATTSGRRAAAAFAAELDRRRSGDGGGRLLPGAASVRPTACTPTRRTTSTA